MLINSLEKMETIVSQNKSLSWNGWDVIELNRNNAAMFKKDGIFLNGFWYIKKVFVVGREGWRIPQKYVM